MIPDNHNEKTIASVCGLYCGACSIYIATTEDPARLKKHASYFKTSEEELKCYGCRAEKRAIFCQNCNLKSCAANYGVEFCGECPEFPCQEFKNFQAEYPHRNEIWQDMENIKKIGVNKWLKEAAENYSCSKCGTVNSPYDCKCRKCGHRPANKFLKKNKNDIKKYLKKNPIL